MGTEPSECYDVFLSYARSDIGRVATIVKALEARGLRVWFDKCDIADFEGITTAIESGLSRSKVLVAYYSAVYPMRRACQVELTAAFLAALNEGDPRGRILVLNPESSAEHIDPIELRDARFLPVPAPGRAADAFIDAIESRVRTLDCPIGGLRLTSKPRWYGGWRGLGSKRFVGRLRELWAVHSLLHASDSVAITGSAIPGSLQIRGLGGIGKSLLAEEYSVRFGAAFPGGIFWLQGQVSRAGQIEAIATELGLDVTGCSSSGEVHAKLAALLVSHNQAYLWVVDDLPAGLDERERRTWYAPTSDGRTLVTTRDRRHGGTGGILDLATLNYEDAYQLLTERRASSAALTLADQQVAREVVQALGAHALALDVAGGYLAANPELPLAAFLRALTESKRDVLALAAELGDELPNGHERNVAATLMTSIASLGEEGRDLLRLGSVLASVPIPRTLADSVFRRADLLSQIDAQARTNRALEQAGALSLVEVIGDEGTSRIKIHALVSRSVHLREPVSGPGGWSSFMGAMDLLRRHRSTRGVLLREAAFAEISQALGGADDIRRSIEVARYVEHARRMTERPETVDEVKLLASVGRYYFRQGAFRDARQVDERVLDARRRLHGKKHPLTLIAMGNLAVSVAAMGERETALVLQQEVLRYRRRLLGDEHRDTLTALSNVAQLLQAQGSLREAREIQERVLATWRRVAGDDHPDTLTAEHNLAGNLKESGDRTAAKELFERVFEAKKRVLGEDHAATLRTLAELADIAREDGDFRTAREFQESIVEIFGHVVEEDHPSTVAAEQKLAETLFEEGDVPNALQHLYRVLEVRRQRLGEEHPETLSAMNDLAVALDGHGDLSVARQLHQRVLEVRQRVLGRDDAATIGTLNNLAGVLVKQGDLKTARKLLERVVDVFQAKFGDESPATLRATNNLAEAVRAQGDLASARTLHGRTLEISRRVLGNRHPDTTRSAWNLYLVLKELHPSAASRLFQQDLSWLSQARSEALSGDQRMIREHLSSLGAFLDAVAGRSQTKPSSKPPFIN